MSCCRSNYFLGCILSLLLAGLIKAADNQAEVFKPQFQRKLMKNEIEYNRRRLQLEDSKDRQRTAEEVYTKPMCSNPQTYTSPLTNSTHVIVLSSGRVGSKMLTAVLFRHFEELGLSGVRLVHQHGFCYQFEQFSNIMVIYLYGFPEDVILGWRKNPYNWVKHGFSYFHNPQLVNFSLWPQVFEVDALGLEAQFDDCLRPHSFPFLSLRYADPLPIFTQQVTLDMKQKQKLAIQEHFRRFLAQLRPGTSYNGRLRMRFSGAAIN